MTWLVLVRHGETIWHAENRYAGSTEIPLNARGREQAERLGRWAAFAQLSAIWVSPQLRTRETAAVAEHATGLVATVDPRLREIDFGHAEGLTVAEIQRDFPEAFLAFQKDPAAHPMPGGEDPCQAAQRAVACFRDIAATSADSRVLVVTHGSLLRLALCRLLGIPLSAYRTVYPLILNGAITEISLNADSASLLQFNVPPDQVTGSPLSPSGENER
jgi:probable phosphoglycerate mutase